MSTYNQAAKKYFVFLGNQFIVKSSQFERMSPEVWLTDVLKLADADAKAAVQGYCAEGIVQFWKGGMVHYVHPEVSGVHIDTAAAYYNDHYDTAAHVYNGEFLQVPILEYRNHEWVRRGALPIVGDADPLCVADGFIQGSVSALSKCLWDCACNKPHIPSSNLVGVHTSGAAGYALSIYAVSELTAALASYGLGLTEDHLQVDPYGAEDDAIALWREGALTVLAQGKFYVFKGVLKNV